MCTINIQTFEWETFNQFVWQFTTMNNIFRNEIIFSSSCRWQYSNAWSFCNWCWMIANWKLILVFNNTFWRPVMFCLGSVDNFCNEFHNETLLKINGTQRDLDTTKTKQNLLLLYHIWKLSINIYKCMRYTTCNSQRYCNTEVTFLSIDESLCCKQQKKWN